VPSMQTKIEAQIRCLGCGYLPEPLARDHLRQGRLVAKRLNRPRDNVRMHYAWRPAALPQPRKPPQGLALQWWLQQLDSPATRAALMDRHSELPGLVD